MITEAPHPGTFNLSTLAQNDIEAAYRLLMKLDLHAIHVVMSLEKEITALCNLMCEAILHKGRLFIVGCGASGRIAAQCEHDWRLVHPHAADHVESVLAGGDITLIEAIEGCEDSADQAIRQMEALNLQPYDCVIGVSASGEAPFILAALEYAKDRTYAPPCLIYTNPRSILLKRNPSHLLGKPGFMGLEILVGEMALTGSTRMQATTAMTLFLILAMFPGHFNLAHWKAAYLRLDLSVLAELTRFEACAYAKNRGVVYSVPAAFGMPVLADLTERSPTFNLPKFSVAQTMILNDAHNAVVAWEKLLLRAPRALPISEIDLSQAVLPSLKRLHPQLQVLNLDPVGRFNMADLNPIEAQFLLRLILVNHSTIMMGRLGYYQGNLMTSLTPSNFKLIDRAIRYARFIAAEQYQQSISYETVAQALFQVLPDLKQRESIVSKVLNQLLQCSH